MDINDNSFNFTSGFGPDDDYGDPPMPAWQPTSSSHSRQPSVAPATQQPLPQSYALERTTLDLPDGQHSTYPQSTLSQPASLRPPPTSHQGSVQPSLPPSRQGSVQPHLPPSRQGSVQPHPPPSRQGSVNLLSHTVDQDEPQDEALMYEQHHIDAQVSKKRPHANVGGSIEPKAKRKARKVP